MGRGLEREPLGPGALLGRLGEHCVERPLGAGEDCLRGGHVERALAANLRRLDEGRAVGRDPGVARARSEEHTSELQSLMRISYAVFCLKKKTTPDEAVSVIDIAALTTAIAAEHHDNRNEKEKMDETTNTRSEH